MRQIFVSSVDNFGRFDDDMIPIFLFSSWMEEVTSQAEPKIQLGSDSSLIFTCWNGYPHLAKAIDFDV